ncbi:hypothetical protein Tsp_10573 [Trichinella spiralis]|uniref:hypothetical protein n=1 Tax=Trichinella spiralis TaxID=6334 RepID=UPI0001EFD790|nr:hypothetical protein Tsp_10573 [Trichinella spiralis]
MLLCFSEASPTLSRSPHEPYASQHVELPVVMHILFLVTLVTSGETSPSIFNCIILRTALDTMLLYDFLWIHRKILTTVKHNCTCTFHRYFRWTMTVGDAMSEVRDGVLWGCYSVF